MQFLEEETVLWDKPQRKSGDVQRKTRSHWKKKKGRGALLPALLVKVELERDLETKLDHARGTKSEYSGTNANSIKAVRFAEPER